MQKIIDFSDIIMKDERKEMYYFLYKLYTYV